MQQVLGTNLVKIDAATHTSPIAEIGGSPNRLVAVWLGRLVEVVRCTALRAARTDYNRAFRRHAPVEPFLHLPSGVALSDHSDIHLSVRADSKPVGSSGILLRYDHSMLHELVDKPIQCFRLASVRPALQRNNSFHD